MWKCRWNVQSFSKRILLVSIKRVPEYTRLAVKGDPLGNVKDI